MADDWDSVSTLAPTPSGASSADPWDAVSTLVGEPQPEAIEGSAISHVIPEAFMKRLRDGEAISKIASRTAETAKYGFGEQRAGFSDAVIAGLQDLGVYHDPLRGRATPLQLVNEAVMQPTAAAVDILFRSMAAGVHGLGGAVGEIVDQMGGRGKAAERETVNFLNMAMLEAGFGRFSRMKTPLQYEIAKLQGENLAAGLKEPTPLGPPQPRPGPQDDLVGFLPRDADFKAAVELIRSENPESAAVVEAKLRQKWEQEGIHPAEVATDAANDVWIRHELSRVETDPATRLPAEAWTAEELVNRAEGRVPEEPLLAAAAPPSNPPLIPLSQQPLPPPGRLIGDIQNGLDKLMDIGHSIQDWAAPMARGSVESMAITKDFANALRRNRWEWARVDDHIVKHFTPEQRKLLWEAADEESVLQQQGMTSTTKGLARLDPAQREFLEDMNARAQQAWMRAVDLGMVDGEGLPFYTPRMLIGVAEGGAAGGNLGLDAIGANLTTSTRNLLHRKHLLAEETEAAAKAKLGEEVELARDIRTLPLAIAQLEDAITGRTLMNHIKEAGRRAGDETVAEGFIPPVPPGARKWFTMADHPAFKTRQKEVKKVEIPGQTPTVTATHEMSFDPGLQAGLERVASELGISIRQPLAKQDVYLAGKPDVMGYTSKLGKDVVSKFGNAQTVLEHEIGHKIDFRYGLSHEIHSQHKQAWKELGELALHRLDKNNRATASALPDIVNRLSSYSKGVGTSPDPLGKYLNYLLNPEERIANLLHAYWYAPKLLQKTAPNAFKWFEDFLAGAPDPLKDAIKAVEPSLRIEGRALQETSVLANPVSIEVPFWKDVPIYVRGDFEGPLRAVLDHKSNAVYRGLMAAKGKTMSVIMNSPMIHNAVEWGRSIVAMPGKVATFRIYFEGNAAKHGVEYTGVARHVKLWWENGREIPAPRFASPTMLEAIDNGLVPIGKRFFNQDITGIMEAPDLKPGRSLTAKTLAMVPGLFDEGKGVAVKRAVDRAGDFWHNTLLWDRIGDLQMGLYVNFRDGMLANGVDRGIAAKVAAHWANRYAGALPKEAMSDAATKIANFMMFSRSFTLGNLGVMKDMLTGLPKDVLAQIERDSGFTRGAIENAKPGTPMGEAVAFSKGMAKRKASAIVALDIGLLYVMNSLLQNMANVGIFDSTWEKELQEYNHRFWHALQEKNEHPLKMLLAGAGIPITAPIAAATAVLGAKSFLDEISATSQNEPGLHERIKMGHADDGTAVYGRNPVGKIGEEFLGYGVGPFDMFRRKMGTMARPIWQILQNDAGFGRKIYDPSDGETPLMSTYRIAEHFFKAQLPEGQLKAVFDLVKGEGDWAVNAAQAFGPFAGLTFRKGAPGGEAVGEMYAKRARQQFAIDSQLKDIRRQIQRGEVNEARERMRELGMAPALINWHVKTAINPRLRLSPKALQQFYNGATPRERERMENAR